MSAASDVAGQARRTGDMSLNDLSGECTQRIKLNEQIGPNTVVAVDYVYEVVGVVLTSALGAQPQPPTRWIGWSALVKLYAEVMAKEVTI